jgi:hypothetical protein
MEGKIKDIEISKRSGIQKIVFEDGSFCLIENGGLRDLIKRRSSPN